jgi:16S rRNA (guanine966-N2)-methyltransferase
MRIIAGTLGGRIFDSPGGHRTHPMSDKARGAIFNALGDIGGLTILDPFAGSGALSFESISRSAAHATAIESDKTAQKTIAQNIINLGLSNRVKLIKAAANAWLSTNADAMFDIILLDPPYDNLQAQLLTKLADHLSPDGILVLSWPGDAKLPEFPKLRLVSTKNYGDIQLGFYS